MSKKIRELMNFLESDTDKKIILQELDDIMDCAAKLKDPIMVIFSFYI
jgi:hypothetical protein